MSFIKKITRYIVNQPSETRPFPGWIDASERQPAVMQEVIVYAHPFPKSEIYVGWHDGQYWHVRGSKCRVTHWTPMPDPPVMGVEAQPG